MTPTTMSIARSARSGSRLESGYFVVARRQKACPLPSPQHAGARSGSIARSAYFMRRGGWLAATATGAAASESVDVDEVDAYILITG